MGPDLRLAWRATPKLELAVRGGVRASTRGDASTHEAWSGGLRLRWTPERFDAPRGWAVSTGTDAFVLPSKSAPHPTAIAAVAGLAAWHRVGPARLVGDLSLALPISGALGSGPASLGAQATAGVAVEF